MTFVFRFPVGSFAIQSIIKSVTDQFSTQTHLEQVGFQFLFIVQRILIFAISIKGLKGKKTDLHCIAQFPTSILCIRQLK